MSTEAKRTPETWKVEGSIYEHMTAEIVSVSPDGERGIAQVWKHDKALEHARLMAAAPELLEALQRLSKLADAIYVKMSDGEMTAMREAWVFADAAIAKAGAA